LAEIPSENKLEREKFSASLPFVVLFAFDVSKVAEGKKDSLYRCFARSAPKLAERGVTWWDKSGADSLRRPGPNVHH